MKDLFGNEIKEPVRTPANKTAIQMHADLTLIHGSYPGKCKDCSHFQINAHYFKCDKASLSGNPKTDWRANWQACGIFKFKG